MPLKTPVLAAAVLLPFATLAGTLPKEGTETYTNIWVVTSSSMMKVADGIVTTSTLDGITTGDEGGLFNNQAGHCLLVYGKFSGKEFLRGTCLKTDKDGDQLIEDVGANGGKMGTSQLAGGTGKFAGITGEDSFSAVTMKSPDGHVMYLVTTKVRYKRP